MRVLDACAAPGGKACHLLELQPGLAELVALDIDPPRAARIRDNLGRLGLAATVVTGDAAEPATWWGGRPFERILLDVPCSGTGVIRRHPDIKLRVAGIDALNKASMLGNSMAQDLRARGIAALYGITPVRRTLMQLGLGAR